MDKIDNILTFISAIIGILAFIVLFQTMSWWMSLIISFIIYLISTGIFYILKKVCYSAIIIIINFLYAIFCCKFVLVLCLFGYYMFGHPIICSIVYLLLFFASINMDGNKDVYKHLDSILQKKEDFIILNKYVLQLQPNRASNSYEILYAYLKRKLYDSKEAISYLDKKVKSGIIRKEILFDKNEYYYTQEAMSLFEKEIGIEMNKIIVAIDTFLKKYGVVNERFLNDIKIKENSQLYSLKNVIQEETIKRYFDSKIKSFDFDKKIIDCEDKPQIYFIFYEITTKNIFALLDKYIDKYGILNENISSDFFGYIFKTSKLNNEETKKYNVYTIYKREYRLSIKKYIENKLKLAQFEEMYINKEVYLVETAITTNLCRQILSKDFISQNDLKKQIGFYKDEDMNIMQIYSKLCPNVASSLVVDDRKNYLWLKNTMKHKYTCKGCNKIFLNLKQTGYGLFCEQCLKNIKAAEERKQKEEAEKRYKEKQLKEEGIIIKEDENETVVKKVINKEDIPEEIKKKLGI
ncbi:hypothetical protein [Megamonas sp.]